MNHKLKGYLTHYATLSILMSLLLNFVIECVSRHSIIEGISYLIGSPLVFLFNSSIILVTYSVLLLVRRKLFAFSFVSAVWLIAGIVNGIVLANRVTPFTANELILMDSVFSILGKYFSNLQIGLMFGAVILLIIAIIYGYLKTPKQKNKINYKKNIPLFAASILSFGLLTQVAIKTELVSTYFGNISFAYLDYGFPYCFSNSLMNTGISRPYNYSVDLVKEIYDDADALKVVDPFDYLPHYVDTENNVNLAASQKPNIILVQLESFFDPTYMQDLTFSEDPVPNFRALKEEFSSGFLRVPSIGAGTANTEFEILTGMNLEYFGPGEYPYKTILKKTTTESVAYNLKDNGYVAHAIHNNKGTFYQRHEVFTRLGFDTFTPLEYMNVTEYTPNGWAKDTVLTQSIMDALNSTTEKDFIYTISVQGHGKYPSTPVEGHSDITISGFDDVSRLNSFEYYVNEINQMDDFIGELVDTLNQINEPTILVLFGDHLPTLDITNEEISNGDTFQTEYVVWNNMNLSEYDQDIEAYQLTAEVLKQVGIRTGILNSYHQAFKEEDDYLSNLEVLQYDMLYGNQYVLGETNPYEQTVLQMGVVPITIDDVYQDGSNVIIKGQNFNQSSQVLINNKGKDAQLIDTETLVVENYTLVHEDCIVVQQATVANHIFGETSPYIY